MHMWDEIRNETKGINSRREDREWVWRGGYVTSYDILE